MIKYLKEYRFYITLFIFLLIPVIAIDTTTRAPRDYRFYDKVVLALTSPIQTVVSWSLEKTIDGFQNYVFLLGARRVNDQLFDENRRLLSEIAQLREAVAENQRLRALLDFREKLRLKTVVARVIARDVSTEFRAVRINRGENAGVRKGMAVVTHEGTVGRVVRTTSGTADVVTILDLLSAVDSVIERSRARGVVEGLNDDFCQMKFVLRTDDIQVADLLVTSGLGGIYPRGIPVGSVTRVNKKPFGITQDVEVRPAVDFSRLDEVMIVTEQTSEVIEKEALTTASALSTTSSAQALPAPKAVPSVAPEKTKPTSSPSPAKEASR